MKKDKSVIGFGVLFTGMLLADLYFMKYGYMDNIAVLAAAAVGTAGAAYLFFDKIYSLILVNQEEKKAHYEESEKADKAKFLLLKKTQELLEEKLSRIEAEQAQLQETLVQLTEAQTKNAKLIVKYNREDMKKVAGLSRADMEKLIAIVGQNSEKQLTAIKKNVSAAEPVDLAPMVEAMNQNFAALNEQIGKLSVNPSVAVAAAVMEEMPVKPVEVEIPVEVESVAEEAVTAEVPVEIEPEPVVEEPVAVEVPVEVEPEPVVEEPEPELITEPEPIEEPAPAPEATAPEIDLSDPNKQMSPDDIAALIASMGAGEASTEPEPVVEEPKPAEEIAAPEIDLSDPNKQMSPDDIAALIASMGAGEASTEPEPVIEEPVAEPEPEPVVEEATAPELDLGDPNKQMSPDDIAALIASMGAGEASTEPVAEEPEPEPIAEPAPAQEVAAPAAASGDPNKQLSPEEIAALFSSLG